MTAYARDYALYNSLRLEVDVAAIAIMAVVDVYKRQVYINGELYKEDIVSASIEDPGVAADEVKLGDDEYFVLGDNRNSSEDRDVYKRQLLK